MEFALSAVSGAEHSKGRSEVKSVCLHAPLSYKLFVSFLFLSRTKTARIALSVKATPSGRKQMSILREITFAPDHHPLLLHFECDGVGGLAVYGKPDVDETASDEAARDADVRLIKSDQLALRTDVKQFDIRAA